MVRRRPLPAVERHPERPDHALGRGDRRGQRVPQAVELLERQHARSPGAARHLRARQPPRDPHRVRRHRHGADGPFEGKRLNSPERRGGQVGRQRLVHRSALRRARQLRGPHRARSSCPPTCTASIRRTGQATVATGDIPRPNGLCFSPDESRLYVVVSRRDAARDPRVRRGRGRHRARQRPRLHQHRGGHPGRPALRHRRQPLVRLGRGRGARRRGGLQSRRASSSAASCCPSAAPTSASAGPSATGSSWPRASRSTRSSSIPRAWPAAERPPMALPTGLRAFRHADFRRFFAAQFVAQVGSWMQTVAQSWLVLQLTSSPLLLGLIGTLQFGPILLFSIVSGAVADRVRKRRLLLVTQSVLGGQALVLGALVYGGHVEYWHVAVLATGVGLANVLDGPARQSFVAEMVGRSDVGSAVVAQLGVLQRGPHRGAEHRGRDHRPLRDRARLRAQRDGLRHRDRHHAHPAGPRAPAAALRPGRGPGDPGRASATSGGRARCCWRSGSPSW